MHNGRFCVTPEYPGGTYCYFTTVDKNWNSAYPYVVGPTFYGVYADRKVTSVNETTTPYVTTTTVGIRNLNNQEIGFDIFPNPSNDIIAIQIKGLNRENLSVEMYDMQGILVQKTILNQGASITHLDSKTVYAGTYLIRVIGANSVVTKKIVISK